MDEGSRAGAAVKGRADLAAVSAVPPLQVSGLVLTRAALVAALRLYVPHAADVETLDGERFLLVLAGAASGDGSKQEEG